MFFVFGYALFFTNPCNLCKLNIIERRSIWKCRVYISIEYIYWNICNWCSKKKSKSHALFDTYTNTHTYTFLKFPVLPEACVMECKSVLQVNLISKNKCKNVFKTEDGRNMKHYYWSCVSNLSHSILFEALLNTNINDINGKHGGRFYETRTYRIIV